jgi:hypothetical protein
LGADETAIQRWCGTWIAAGFDAIEAWLAADKQRKDFCFSDVPTPHHVLRHRVCVGHQHGMSPTMIPMFGSPAAVYAQGDPRAW